MHYLSTFRPTPTYKIAGYKGRWRYNGRQGDKYQFYRFQAERRLTLNLSERQMDRVLEISPTPINLAQLEAFGGC